MLQKNGKTKHSPPSTTAPDPSALLTSAAVRRVVGGISEMTLWRWSRDRSFPPPDLVIARRKFWRRATVQNWIAAQIAADDDRRRQRELDGQVAA